MEKHEVIDLMKSSKNEKEWNENCDTVKRNNGGHYTVYWYSEMIASGLINEILGDGSDKITIRPF